MAEAQLFNQAQQAEFGMRTAQVQMENARKMGDMQAYNQALESYNNAQLASTQMNRDQANFRNNVRTAQVGEQEALKNSELNRLVSLLSGAQVQNPNIPGYFSQGVNAPDYSGLVQSNYAQEVGAHNAQMQGMVDLLSGGMNIWRGGT